MNHPNLSLSINKAISQSEKDGGLWLKDLPDNCMVEVQTQNTKYEIRRLGEGWEIKGSKRFCPDWTPCHISGSTWGGSMLKMGFIGMGMCLEFGTPTSRRVTTSFIKEVWVK